MSLHIRVASASVGVFFAFFSALTDCPLPIPLPLCGWLCARLVWMSASLANSRVTGSFGRGGYDAEIRAANLAGAWLAQPVPASPPRAAHRQALDRPAAARGLRTTLPTCKAVTHLRPR